MGPLPIYVNRRLTLEDLTFDPQSKPPVVSSDWPLQSAHKRGQGQALTNPCLYVVHISLRGDGIAISGVEFRLGYSVDIRCNLWACVLPIRLRQVSHSS